MCDLRARTCPACSNHHQDHTFDAHPHLGYATTYRLLQAHLLRQQGICHIHIGNIPPPPATTCPSQPISAMLPTTMAARAAPQQPLHMPRQHTVHRPLQPAYPAIKACHEMWHAQAYHHHTAPPPSIVPQQAQTAAHTSYSTAPDSRTSASRPSQQIQTAGPASSPRRHQA
jgi:hypothetical protein